MPRPLKDIVTSSPIGTEAALGAVAGHTAFLQTGANPSTDTTGAEVIWDAGGAYVHPDDTGTLLQVSSSDTQDHGDTANDTGAITVEIFGLDTDLGEQNEVVLLDGDQQVASASKYRRLFRAIVRSAGSNGANVGDLYIGIGTATSGIPPTIFGKILAGENETHMAVYTVPAAKRAVLNSVNVHPDDARSMLAKLMVRPTGEVFSARWTGAASVTERAVFDPPMVFEAGTDLEIRAKGDTVAAHATYGGFDILLVPDQT